MIIECPACRTKFSIDGQLVREIEDPRFHCSRCGQYFQQSKDPQRTEAEPCAETGERKQWQVDHNNVESLLTKEPLHGEQLALIPDPPLSASITVPADYSCEVEPLVANLDDLPFARTVSPDADFEPFFQTDWADSPAESWSTGSETSAAENLDPESTFAHAGNSENNDENPFAEDFGDLLKSSDDAEQVVDRSIDHVRQSVQQTGSVPGDSTAKIPIDSGVCVAESERSDSSTEFADSPSGSTMPHAGSTALPSGTGNRDQLFGTQPASKEQQSHDAPLSPSRVSSSPSSNPPSRPRVPSAMINAEPNEVGSVKRMMGNIEERKTELRRATLARRQEAARQLDKEERKAQKRAQQHERYLEPIRDTPAANWVGVDERTWLQESNSALSSAPVLFAASVPLLCMLCFSIVAADLSLLPSVVRTAFQLNADQLPKLPPPGLEVTNLQSQVISLHDGNKVLEVRGEIINATLRDYKDVRVEAVLYDGENTQIRQRVVDVSSGLLEARLPALRSDAIEELQEPQELEGLTVAPHQKAPFRVVFTDLSGKERWLASRVFSVKRG